MLKNNFYLVFKFCNLFNQYVTQVLLSFVIEFQLDQAFFLNGIRFSSVCKKALLET